MIALVITAILMIGIKESARFNATIVTIKVAVVLFVIGLGIHYVSAGQLGIGLGDVSRLSDSPESGREPPTSSSHTSDSTRFRPPRRKRRIRSAIFRSASLLRC